MNRFDRLAAILIQLQAKRVVSGPALAERFGVRLRTELAGAAGKRSLSVFSRRR